MHVLDSWVGSFRSVTITRSAGIAVSRALQEFGVSWATFRREFLGLVESTLELQVRCNGLVHGDIHEGNLLYYYCDCCHDDDHHHPHDSEIETEIDSEGEPLFPVGHRLVFIDWDEASRPKPCRRIAETHEERLRYPEGLLDFPEQYTQQQLLHLFRKLTTKYYPLEAERAFGAEDSDELLVDQIYTEFNSKLLFLH